MAELYDLRDCYDRSVPLLRELAEAGEADAQILIYLAYHHGDGVCRSDEQAMEWLEMSISGGSPEAFYIRGRNFWCQYGGGHGMSDLIIASEKGFAPAMSILACMYEQGHGAFLFKIPNRRKQPTGETRQQKPCKADLVKVGKFLRGGDVDCFFSEGIWPELPQSGD